MAAARPQTRGDSEAVRSAKRKVNSVFSLMGRRKRSRRRNLDGPARCLQAKRPPGEDADVLSTRLLA